MTNLKLSKHAEVRMQQRCIPAGVVEWLMTYGEQEFDKHGCVRMVFTKRSVKRMISDFGRYITRVIDEFQNAYLVMSVDGKVVTAAYRD